MKKHRIVVVDDHKLIREMYTQLFLDNDKIEVVGESGTIYEAIELIKQLKPDIVFLDINLGDETGMDAVPQILEFSPNTRIIAISMHNQLPYVKKMLKLGAKAYVTKNSSQQEIFTAIQQVMKGKIYVCDEIKTALANQVLFNEKEEPKLTFREHEIINLVKKGFTSKEIALNTNISPKTVEVHRYNILKKLKLKNTASLINFFNVNDPTFN